MSVFAALDVSQDETAICVVDQDGRLLVEGKVPTCPDAIADWLTERAEGLERVGMETGPLAVWLWNALTARQIPVVCLDARHANGVLKMMPNKTDRHDARGLAQIVRTGWFKAVQIKSHDAYVNRALLTARDALVGMRVRLENEIRGLLKTFADRAQPLIPFVQIPEPRLPTHHPHPANHTDRIESRFAEKGEVFRGFQLAVTLHAMWRTNTPFQEAARA